MACIARRIITVLTDDLDGGDAEQTVEFGLDGVSYTIDLSEKNASKLRKALEPYLSVAAKAGRALGRRDAAGPSRVSARETNQAIRKWAVKNGWAVSERGRIPSSVVEAYNNR
jgi:Lsr2